MNDAQDSCIPGAPCTCLSHLGQGLCEPCQFWLLGLVRFVCMPSLVSPTPCPSWQCFHATCHLAASIWCSLGHRTVCLADVIGYILRRSTVMVLRWSSRDGRPWGHLLRREQFFQDQTNSWESWLLDRKEPSLSLVPCFLPSRDSFTLTKTCSHMSLLCLMLQAVLCTTRQPSPEPNSPWSPYPGLPGFKAPS